VLINHRLALLINQGKAEMTPLYFVYDMTIAPSPGVAVQCRAGEIVELDDEIAAALLKKSSGNYRRPEGRDAEARRRTTAECLYPAEVAKLISPDFDEDALLAGAEREAKRDQARRMIAAREAARA
jgi:hypothetical protein